jgi:dolichyl-diphosphooligosaccharide--protein glycosyltransferase
MLTDECLFAALLLFLDLPSLPPGSLFLVLYGITAVYFSGVMVRLMLVLAPAVCCLSGVAISDILSTLTASLKAGVQSGHSMLFTSSSSAQADENGDAGATADADGAGPSGAVVVSKGTPGKGGKKRASAAGTPATTSTSSSAASSGLGNLFGIMSDKPHALPAPVAALGLLFMLGLMMLYTIHCVGVSSDMYSAPSIVLQSGRQDGSVYVFDDFREAYAWLRHNTHPEAKVASW